MTLSPFHRVRTLCVLAFALQQSVALGALTAQSLARTGAVPHDAAREKELLQGVKVPDGFHASVFAAPPVAMYPTCLTGTLDGAVFVCVDPNLSLSANKGRGRIVRLVDTDNDGSADRFSVFAEMDSPRGVAYDGRTLYVMHPPVLTAYRDTTNDGIADVSEDLVTGLGFDLDFRGADHTTNGITLGIDGWLYVAVGDYGYRHAVGKDGTAIERRGGGVVRVRTDGTGLELYASGTRNIYDVAIDPFLHVFTRDNTNDGDGWDTRLHYLPRGANMGYPMLYKNFASEHMPSLADYGSGSGTGGLFIHDPGFPEGFGNTLYTTDWLTNQVLRHPLQARGASFEVKQEPFITVPHPSDLAMDGRSNLLVASLAGGSFNYVGDTVGYVLQVRYGATAPGNPPVLASLNDAALRGVLVSANAEHRLQAQREILRRGDKGAVASALASLTLDRKQPAYARVAAMFTLRQLVGERALPTLTRAVADPGIRALALRAMVDNSGQNAKVDAGLIAKSLTDTSGEVQAAAIAALVRINAHGQASSIIPLTGSTDAAVAHLAVNGLVSLRAWEPALAALNGASPAVRTGIERALQQMHDPALITALAARVSTPEQRRTERNLVMVLARLYQKEPAWGGDWWGTRPSFIGPYFAPAQWEESARIAPLLRQALLEASASDTPALVDALIRNRVIPQGSRALFAAIIGQLAVREEVVKTLVGSGQLTAAALPLLTRLNANAEQHAAIAELLAAEPGVVDGALPLIRSAVLDSALTQDVRAKLLNLASAVTGRAGLDAAANLFARVTPATSSAATTPAAPVEAAWRRFVGDRRRLQELDYFIDLSHAATSNQRVLAFAVLLQSVRGNRAPANITDKVQPVLNAAWSSRESVADLVRAVNVMRLESQYAERLAERLAARNTARATATYNWTPLFNGRDLRNWDIKFAGYPLGENFRNTFRADSGMLMVRYDQWPDFKGEFGHIFYKTPFSYYIVAVEYRFVGEQVTGAGAGNSWAIRNNGIMVHSQSAQSMGLKQDFPISLEVQLLGGLGRGTRTNGNLCTPGTNVVMNDKLVTTHCINSTSNTYDGDQWVRVEAMVLGDSVIKHIVNGDTVLTYFKPQMGGGNANNTNPGVLVEGKMLAEGYISLQAETAPIDFRKVEIVNLKGCMNPGDANYKPYFVKSDPAACRKK